jgi:hypothetical protein
MESDWGKSVNMLISSTPFGELFTVDSRQRNAENRAFTSLDLGLYSAGNYRTGHFPRRGLVYFASSQISPIIL